MQISNFDYLMQLNTLAGRSYNDITQVIFFLNLLLFIIKLFILSHVVIYLSLLFIFGSTQFSPGFFLITVLRAWIFLILLLTEIFQRYYIVNLDSISSMENVFMFSLITNAHDMMQPVGALNPDRLKKFQERYASFNDPVIPKFHYGSHYSSAGTVGFPSSFFFSKFAGSFLIIVVCKLSSRYALFVPSVLHLMLGLLIGSFLECVFIH